VAVLLHADQALRAAGGRLVLTRPTRLARRVLAITGLGRVPWITASGCGRSSLCLIAMT
jgi:anti-anti-sigma regulatory factor